MKRLFYLMGAAFIIYELIWILRPQEQVDKSKKFKELSKTNKGKAWEDMGEEYKDLLIVKGLPSLFILVWLIAGLFTFNWVLFLIKLVFNFTIVLPLSKLSNFGLGYTLLHWLNSLLGFMFGVFAIVNSYHLKIDIWEFILQWL